MLDQEKQENASETLQVIPVLETSRRCFLKWGVIGGLSLSPFALYLWRSKHKSKVYEMILYPPFPEYEQKYVVGVPELIRAESNGEKTHSSKINDRITNIAKTGEPGKIEIRTVCVKSDKVSDIVTISYNYRETLYLSTIIRLECNIYDCTNSIIGTAFRNIISKPFKEDELPVYGSSKVYQSYIDLLKIKIPKNTRNSIQFISITAMEVPH